MIGEYAIWAALLAPILQAALVLVCARPPGLRDVVHIGFSLVTAGAALSIVGAASNAQNTRIVLAQPLPDADLAFAIEPLGALVGCVIAGLGVLHAIHAAGYARATHAKTPARMMALIALTQCAAIAACFSANLFTYFVCAQFLSLVTFALMQIDADEDGRRAARTYLAVLLAGGFGALLPAIVWTYAAAGSLEFGVGGVLAGQVDALSANALLVLFVFGLTHAATPPLHRWLAASGAASFPAMASVQAIAVVPVGGVGVLKVTAYIFGSAMHDAELASRSLLILTGVGMCYAALIALSKQDIRERLAYAAMAQSMAVLMGALLALPAGTVAAALQIVALACALSTLLMAAGAAHAVTGRARAAELHGLGRVMPWTMAGFALGAASLIGMPPFSGAWSKLWLITAVADAGQLWAAALVGVASVLIFAGFGPLAANALVAPAPKEEHARPDGASLMLSAPVILSAAATLWLLVLADPVAWFLAPLWGQES